MCQCLDVLLVQVWAVVEKHTDGGVLEACARVACALSSPRYTFSSRADLALSQLLDGLTDRFSSHLNDLLQVNTCTHTHKHKHTHTHTHINTYKHTHKHTQIGRASCRERVSSPV